MPKLKTHKATKKRVVFTKTNKILVRTAGQDHFNARESGKVTRNKRRDRTLVACDQRRLKKLLPYC